VTRDRAKEPLKVKVSFGGAATETPVSFRAP
jgi:hypothetical protein